MADASLLHEGGHSKGGMTCALATAVFISLPGALQFGYASGVLNDPEKIMEQTLGISSNAFALAVAIFAIGGAFGTQVGGRLADRFGRRNFLWFHGIIFVISGALEALCPSLPAPLVWLVIARFLIGFGSGGASVVVPLFIGEISPQSLRGSLAVLNQVAITSAILVSQIGGQFLSTNPEWRYLIAGTAYIGVAQLLTGWMLPESPKWLAQNNRPEEAKKVLLGLRGYSEEDAQAELAVIQETANTNVANRTLKDILTAPDLRPQLLILFTVHASQQLSGINAVFYYSTSFFESSGIKNSSFATLLVGVVNVMATVAGCALMEKAGRRPLIVWGALTMCLASVAITVMLNIEANTETVSPFLGYVTIFCVLVFVSGFEVGLGGIPWAIGTEIFAEDARATAMGVGGSLNWFCNFLIGIGFPAMNRALKAFSFMPFAVVLALCFTMTYYKLPETKDRTVSEIEVEFARLNGRAPKKQLSDTAA